MQKKQFFITIILFITILLLSMTTSKAVQSRPNVATIKKSPTMCFPLIRQMETSSGPMGLNAIVNDTGKETSASNNIDVHMIKNTEWGVMAMLSASNYGEIPTSTKDLSTTGNNTGIFQTVGGSWEYVAGMWDIDQSHNTNIYHAEEKYWDKYTDTKSKVGDATLEFIGWKIIGATKSTFITPDNSVFLRGTGAILSYSNTNNSGLDTTRAAVVCGSGF